MAPTNVEGQLLSATATDQSGNTSEFAKSIQVTTALPSTPIGTTTVLSVSPAGVLAGQPVTLMATVSAVDGSIADGRRDLLRGWAGPRRGGAARGRHRSRYGDVYHQPDDSRHVRACRRSTRATRRTSAARRIRSLMSSTGDPAESAVVPQPAPQPATGPAVVSVEWVGNHSTSTTIVVQFNQALDQGPRKRRATTRS